MRIRLALAVAVALVGGGIVLALSERAPRLAGTSFVPQGPFQVVVPAGATACQPGTYLADDSAAAELLMTWEGRARPPLVVAFVAQDGRTLARGRLPGRAPADGGAGTPVVVPFEDVVDGSHAARACVRNAGTAALTLSGDVATPTASALVAGRAVGGVAGFRYLREGRESWWSLAPVVAQRFGLGKAALFGSWTLPLLALVVVALWCAVVRLLLREAA